MLSVPGSAASRPCALFDRALLAGTTLPSVQRDRGLHHSRYLLSSLGVNVIIYYTHSLMVFNVRTADGRGSEIPKTFRVLATASAVLFPRSPPWGPSSLVKCLRGRYHITPTGRT